jgi:hypothetical protein
MFMSCRSACQRCTRRYCLTSSYVGPHQCLIPTREASGTPTRHMGVRGPTRLSSNDADRLGWRNGGTDHLRLINGQSRPRARVI